MSAERLERASYALLALGLLATLGAMLYAGQPRSWRWLVGVSGFAGWAALPWLACGFAVRWLSRSRAASALMLAASALLCAATAWLLVDTLFVHIDAQGGLVFLFLPVWQLVALAPCVGAALWLRGRAN